MRGMHGEGISIMPAVSLPLHTLDGEALDIHIEAYRHSVVVNMCSTQYA